MATSTRVLLLTFNLFSLLLVLVKNQATTIWTDRPDLRMGQTSIYDAVYIPLGINSLVDLPYKSAFTDPIVSGTDQAHRGVVLSGFENYLHYQIKVQLTITDVYADRITVDVYVGATTYIKQLNINYFIMIPAVADGKYASVQVLTANYLTSDLDESAANPLEPRTQTFNTESTSLTNVAAIFSAIQGIDYFNEDGIVNEVFINTKLIGTNGIQQEISVAEKGKIFQITIMTIVIDQSYYPNTPDLFQTLGQVLTTSLKNDDTKSGFEQLDYMNKGGLFSKDNGFFFGIKGFKFKMEQTRLFLLTISPTTQLMSASNLQGSSWQYVDISMLVMIDRECTVAPPDLHYFVQEFNCVLQTYCTAVTPFAPYLTNSILVKGTPDLLCLRCASVCDGCTGDIRQCTTCVAGSNRQNTGAIVDADSPPTCLCETGYIEINQAVVCKKCSDLIPGCSLCQSQVKCDTCAHPTFLDPNGNSTHQICVCADNTYLVTGICLSYPGCIEANIYITGQFCQNCDGDKNFEKKLDQNSKCACKLAFYNDNNPQICQDRCGDGQTPESPPNVTETQIICDDNNTKSGDGCSSTCRQQFGYICTIEKPGEISVCAEKQEIKINYLYSQKNLIGNQGIIVFALLPPQNSLAETAFDNSISMNVPGQQKIKFDPINSLIIITVDYPQSLQSNEYEFTFSFAGLRIHSPDIVVKATLSGINAKLQMSETPHLVNIITYVAMGVSAFALALALISSFLGEKLLGIELILPVQAAFFSMATLPAQVLSPISALWSLKFSNGYNQLTEYDFATNYMLDNRITIMQYSGQYILNYNIMFLLLVLVLIIIAVISIRIAWLEREEKRIEEIQKKKEDQDKKQNKNKNSSEKEDEKETQDESKKDDENNPQKLEEQLDDIREIMKNWKNLLYMVFDRFFSILIITSMMKVIFCFYIQLSNLTYTAEVYDNSLNAGFFFLSYIVIVTGLYTIVYDYKADKLIVFTCNKGKYAMFYITIFLGYIIVLGAVFETMIAVYFGIVFAIMPIVLIFYQVPYGLRCFDFQAIIAVICQFPFVVMITISLMLHLQKESITESTCMMFAYAIIGSIGLSIILTIIRLIKVIDCKKVSCVQFTDRKKQNSNDKKKKKNKVGFLQIEMDKEQDQEDSVRALFFNRQKNPKNDDCNKSDQQPDQADLGSKKNDTKNKDKQKAQGEQQDDDDIDELQKIKVKLRKELKQKKASGKVK